MPAHPEDWTSIDAQRDGNGHVLNLQEWLTEVQAMADNGYFVVGVAHGIGGPGHIVVVIPSSDGNLVTGNWSVPVPHTIDCGAGRRSENTNLSAGFGNQEKWQDRIRFYYHK